MKLSLLCFIVSFSVYGKGDHGCFFQNEEFAVGVTFKDPDNPCLTYTCTEQGFTTQVQECSEQSWCRKELRTYEASGCCYACQNDCQLAPLVVSISKEGCKGRIRMNMCKGACKQVISYSEERRAIQNQCFCCRGKTYVPKSERLFCTGGRVQSYIYKDAVSCTCEPCKFVI